MKETTYRLETDGKEWDIIVSAYDNDRLHIAYHLPRKPGKENITVEVHGDDDFKEAFQQDVVEEAVEKKFAMEGMHSSHTIYNGELCNFICLQYSLPENMSHHDAMEIAHSALRSIGAKEVEKIILQGNKEDKTNPPFKPEKLEVGTYIKFLNDDKATDYEVTAIDPVRRRIDFAAKSPNAANFTADLSEKSEYTIGRDGESDLQLLRKKISRTHGQILFQDGAFFYEHLGRNDAVIQRLKKTAEKDQPEIPDTSLKNQEVNLRAKKLGY